MTQLTAALALAVSEPDYRVDTLENGLLVVTFPMPWLHEVGVTLFVRAGSRFERPEEAGIAHFLEHMLFKGTASIPDATRLHARLEAMAADMNAATGQESNAYWLSLPPEGLEEGFLTFCEIFTQPVFQGLETERRVILAEMREDFNDLGEQINATVLGAERLWPGHPLARPVLGAVATLEGIDRPALAAYLARLYTGCNMALAWCGPIEPATALRLSRQALGGLPVGTPAPLDAPPPMPPGPHWVAVNDQTSQFTLSLFFRTVGYRDADLPKVGALRRLLDDGFSSRLQATVREREGLVYDIWATYTGYYETGSLEIGATVSPEHLLEVVDALLREIRLLCREPPDAEEWARVVTRWRASLTGTLDRPAELTERYVADQLCDCLETLEENWRQVRALQPEQLPAFARSLLTPANLALVLVGPRAKEVVHDLKERLAPKYWTAPPPRRARRRGSA